MSWRLPALQGLWITPMARRHLSRVVEIEQQVYPQPWSEGLFESELGQHGRTYLCAWQGRGPARRLLGYGGVMVAAGEAHIMTVAVDPAVRRRKVASHLVVRLLEAAIKDGATAATLEVRATNRGAQRLYTGFGFAPVGVRPGYYSATGEDAIIMWAYDIDQPAYAERLAAQRDRLGHPGGASGAPDHPVPASALKVGQAASAAPGGTA